MDRDRAALGARAARWVIPLGFLGFFFAYPLVTILGRGLWPSGDLDLSPIADVFERSDLRGVVWFTFWQAAASTALTMALALPMAYVTARFRFPGRGLVRAITTVAFVLPTVVVASAFRALGFEHSVVAILLAHAFFNYAVVVRAVGSLWEHLDPRQEQVARVLGASRWRAFVHVTMPALRPALLAAASIVFLFSFTSFGVIALLGGPQRATLETQVFREAFDFADLEAAAGLAVVQLAAVATLLFSIGRFQGRRGTALSLASSSSSLQRVRSRSDRLVVLGTLLSAAVLLGAPIMTLVARSFDTAHGFGFDSYEALNHLGEDSVLFVAPVDAIVNSLLFAAAATVIALCVGGPAAFVIARSHRARALDTALALPLGVSAVMLGLGFLLAFDPPIDLRTSWILVPIAHALIAIPFVVRIVVPVLRSIDPRLREAAAMLGAGPRTVWREIDLAVAWRGLLVAAGFSFAISLGEFGATVFIARPDRPTVPVVIYRLLGQPGVQNFGAAMAASTILMLLTLVAVLSIERFRVRSVGAF